MNGFTAADMTTAAANGFRDGFAAQPAAAQEAVAYLDIGAGGYLDLGSALPEEQLLALPNGRHALGIIGTYGIDGYVSAPVAAAPGIDLTSLVPTEREKPELMMATWHEVAGWNACVAEIRRRIDASPKGALPALPDDFSESKDWRAGSYGERVEWLMDTVRSQREHIAALLDNH